MEEWGAILAAAGLGSILTSIVQSWLARRSLRLEAARAERREAFVGLLEAWRDQDKEGVTAQNRFDVGHWIARCELVGSVELCKSLDFWTDTEPGTQERANAWKELKQAIKRDLA